MKDNPSGDAPDRADRPSFHRMAEALAELATGQELLELPVRVVDADGQPVAKARLTPWALGSSLGHGLWRENDKWAGVGPEEVFTDERGTASVHYPRYHDVEERICTRRVTLYIDHPDFACVDNLHVEVPLETQAPFEIKLPTGFPLWIRLLLDGALADLDDIFAFWSDGRSYRTGAASAKPADGRLRIPAMPPGEKSILLVKLDGDRATHFSKLTDVTCDADARQHMDVPLRPAVRIEGILSQNVPRPVRRGRVEARTLAPAEADVDRVGWLTWTPVRPDGSFAIDGWPADEPLQLIALCDGHIAANGTVPDVVENRREAEKIPVKRPQVFDATGGERIEVAMAPLVRCVVSAVDQDGQPASSVTVSSYPNVFWWNSGSHGYCHPLVRGERLLRIRDYYRAEDEAFPCPFKGQTDADGKLTLELPVGTRTLSISSDTYELPIHGGRRRVHVKATRGETAEVVLHLQPRGAERKGEWDTLIDVVFRSSIRSCPLLTVWEQMDQFVKKYRAAMNQRDPRLVGEACLAAADALEALGNSQEATKWRHMAAEQTETAEDIDPDSGKKAAKD